MPVNEFLDRFAAIAAASGWTEEQKGNKLIAATSKKAYAMLRNVVIDGTSAAQRFETLKRELLKSFGLTPEKAFTALCARMYDHGREDLDAYANELAQLTNTAFPGWSPGRLDELASRFFWRGLPSTAISKNLVASIRSHKAEIIKHKRTMSGEKTRCKFYYSYISCMHSCTTTRTNMSLYFENELPPPSEYVVARQIFQG